jgi:hypothetical protein
MAKAFRFASKLAGIISPAKPVTLNNLIEEESKIGGTLFGTTPKGVSRRFFLDEHDNWFYTQSTFDSVGRLLDNYTIRYHVQENGIIKSVDGKHHTLLEGQELQDLLKSVDIYHAKTKKELYETKLGLQSANPGL